MEESRRGAFQHRVGSAIPGSADRSDLRLPPYDRPVDFGRVRLSRRHFQRLDSSVGTFSATSSSAGSGRSGCQSIRRPARRRPPMSSTIRPSSATRRRTSRASASMPNGELYSIAYVRGEVYRLVLDGPAPPDPPGPPAPPNPPPPVGDACSTSDPFVSLGGGTCCNGGWLPPGLTCAGAPTQPPPSEPPPTEPPPSPPSPPPGPTPPPSSASCSTGDPFASLGGGTCCNGGWLPPGMACSNAPVTPPPPSTDPPPPTDPPIPPPSGGGGTCASSDPFVFLGGGTCCGGGWLPPGMACSAPPPVTPPQDPPAGAARGAAR